MVTGHMVGSIMILASTERKRVGIIIPDNQDEIVVDLTVDQAKLIADAIIRAINEVNGNAEVIL